MTQVTINERIGAIQFDKVALHSSFAKEGLPVPTGFVDDMRRSLREYTGCYEQWLGYREVYRRTRGFIREVHSYLASELGAELSALRKAFELLGQESAVLKAEIAGASNYIMRSL